MTAQIRCKRITREVPCVPGGHLCRGCDMNIPHRTGIAKTDEEMMDDLFRMSKEIDRELLFHDTVPLPPEQLEKGRKKAVIQNGIVLDFFRKRFAYKFTAVKVHEILTSEGEKILLTSVRRSITNLTKAGRLTKCQYSESEEGLYDKLNRCWRYNQGYVNPINPKK